ncbi:MAG TPA: DUF2520 domain-containing protein [Burkholderiales bacterium]|jgi:predicted short-subunit dehydrogenase-like oxidoreductase (DUF2520 family)
MLSKRSTLGFIGAGRVATGLATGFARAGREVVAVAGRNADSARELARRVRGARACAPQEVADRADIVFLTVPDDAIEAVASGLRWRKGAACVHCSGAAELDALAKAAADGALAGGFHPLHMFGEPGFQEALAGCSIAVAGPDALVEQLEELARALGARPLRLPEGGRALYHAAANFSGAFVLALVQETVALWGKLGIAEADALAALLPLLRGTVDNVERLGAAGGLGSVIARGDIGTIRRHLDVLADFPRSLELYRLLSLRTIPLAIAKGTLKAEAAKEIAALLVQRSGGDGDK